MRTLPFKIIFAGLINALIVHSTHGQGELEFSSRELSSTEVELFCKNSGPGSYSVRVDFNLTNMTSSRDDNSVFVVPSGEEISFAVLTATGGKWKYGFSSDYVQGDVYAVHDEQHIYHLPHAGGRDVRIMQGYGGSFSHTASNALDWDLEEGSPILCVRDGIVVDVRQDSQHGCMHPRCIDAANFIKIEHSDGTIADYAHLQYQGSEVQEGDSVSAGQLIGFSGNTGWSSGPHLHLKIFVSTFDARPTGIRTRFHTSRGARYLEEGQTYRF
ncbi:MAG: M23 family metallopeptidase [Saprospiraceae bacterium]|nr:M23 family metallopeptidase [Saprospiraceae bacterium]